MRSATRAHGGWLLPGCGALTCALGILVLPRWESGPASVDALDPVSPEAVRSSGETLAGAPACVARPDLVPGAPAWAESAFAAELGRLLAEPESVAREDAIHRQLEQWIAETPAEAAGWAAARAAERGQSSYFVAALSRWSLSDPAAVIEWARAGLAPPWREVAFATAAQEWAGSDPRAVAELLPEFSEEPLRQQTAALVAMRWFPAEPEAARAWAEGLAPGPLADAVWGQAILWLAASDPDQAARLTLTQLTPGPGQDRAIVGVVQRWAQSDPELAAAWVRRFPAGRIQRPAVENLVRIWARSDPPAAAAWVQGLPLGELRDEAELVLAAGAGGFASR